MTLLRLLFITVFIFSSQVFAQDTAYNISQFGKVAVLQWSPEKATPKDVTRDQAEAIKQSHRLEMSKWITIAADNGAEIVITPEYSVVGYPDEKIGAFQSRKDIEPYVETVPGTSTQFFAALAKKLGVYIHVGFAEVDQKSQLYYNAVVALSPTGEVAAHYRKMSLFGSEPKYLEPGTEYVTYISPIGRVGLLICADVYDIKVMDTYYGKGVRKFLVGASWSIDNDAIPTFAWAARTWYSFIAAANTTDHPGSGVFNKNGKSQAVLLKGNGLLYGFIPRD